MLISALGRASYVTLPTDAKGELMGYFMVPMFHQLRLVMFSCCSISYSCVGSHQSQTSWRVPK